MKYILGIMLVFLLSGCELNQEISEVNNDYVEEIDNLERTVIEQQELINSLNDIIEQDRIHLDSLNVNIEELEEELIEYMNSDKELNELQTWMYDIQFINGNSDKGWLTYNVSRKEEANTINIIGSDYDLRGEMYTFEHRNIAGSGMGEIVRVIVNGAIYDFKLIKLDYENGNIDSPDQEVLHSFDVLINEEIVIDTSLSETIPFEIITWMDAEGNEYQADLFYNGIGASGRIYLPSNVE